MTEIEHIGACPMASSAMRLQHGLLAYQL